MRARTFLRRHCEVSARIITLLKREKDGILKNGEILRTVDLVKAGDSVVLNLPEDKSDIVPVEGEVNIVYEDDYVLVADKPAGMPVHPTKVHQLNTLANRLAYLQRQRGESFTFRALNRLDKDTSGLVVIAKNKFFASAFGRIDKVYYAVCEGVIEQAGTVDKPIRLMEGHGVQRTVAPDGARAVTHYKPIRAKDGLTLVELVLETGRTHQIRCHMASIGHPLAGDDMYGGSLDKIKRQALHCARCRFVHPVANKEISLSSELPKEILELIEN